MLEQILSHVVMSVARRGIGNTINDLTGETARRQEAERQASLCRYKERCQHNSNVRRRVFDMIVSSEMESLKQNKEACTFNDEVVRQFCEKKVRMNIDERLNQTRIMLRQFREKCQRMCDAETVEDDLSFWNERVEAHRTYCKEYLIAMGKDGLSDFDSMKLIVQAQKLALDEEDTDRIVDIADRYRISIDGVEAFGREGTEYSSTALKAIFHCRDLLKLYAEVLKEWSEAGGVYFDADDADEEESDWIDDEVLGTL